MRRLLVALLLFDAAACSEDKKRRRATDEPEAESRPSAAPSGAPTASERLTPSATPLGSTDLASGVDGAPPPETTAPLDVGPAATASPADRRAGVLGLLAGGDPATRLPTDAEDPGKAWDPGQLGRVRVEKRPAPLLRLAAVSVSGRLPPEVVTRIVRQSFGKLRRCYEKGLEADPGLAGEVKVRFTIDEKGAVKKGASALDPHLASRSVESCMVRVLSELSFPAPEGGVVSVVLPVRLTAP